MPALQFSELSKAVVLCNQYYRQEREQWEHYLRDEGPHQPPRQHHCDERRQVVVNKVEILKKEREKVFTRGRDSETTHLGWDWKVAAESISTLDRHAPNLPIRNMGEGRKTSNRNVSRGKVFPTWGSKKALGPGCYCGEQPASSPGKSHQPSTARAAKPRVLHTSSL